MWLSLVTVYLLLLAVVLILTFRLAKSDTTANFFRLYMLATTLSESISFYLYLNGEYNVIVYHIYNPIQLLILSTYYNQIISFFKSKGVGYIIGVAGIFMSIFNSFFLQPPPLLLNTYFIVIEALFIISMTLCYFYDFLNTKPNTKHFTTPDFWISCLLLLFWSFTFFRWLASLSMPGVVSANMYYILYMMWAINIITYTGFGLVFLFYRKLQSR